MKNDKIKDIVLFENEDYIILNKPPMISSLEDRVDERNMLRLARSIFGEVFLCHRLDKETSGVLTFARSKEAYKNVSLQFQKRKVNKIYHAVVDGIHDFRNREVDSPVKTSARGVSKVSNEGKSSFTRFNTVDVFKKHSLIECKPVTGRTHQIRVHLASLEAPISGDIQYGGFPFYLSSIKRRYNLKKGTEEQPLISRIALHARSIKFKGMDGKDIKVKAPYPKDFDALLNQLEKNI